jgi:hypothetical protein
VSDPAGHAQPPDQLAVIGRQRSNGRTHPFKIDSSLQACKQFVKLTLQGGMVFLTFKQKVYFDGWRIGYAAVDQSGVGCHRLLTLDVSSATGILEEHSVTGYGDVMHSGNLGRDMLI